MKLSEIITEAASISKIVPPHHSPKGLWADGDMHAIVNWLRKEHGKDTKKAVDAIDFYVNRGGSNIPKHRLEIINRAKAILQKN